MADRPIFYCSNQQPATSMPPSDRAEERQFEWSGLLSRFTARQRLAAVHQALTGARAYAAAAVFQATGQELHEILLGVIPGLLLMLSVLAATATLGAAAGAAIGALAMGVGAAPGAAVGAGLGLEAGTAILSYLGLAFLTAYIGRSLFEAGQTAGRAIELAWNSVDLGPCARIAVVRRSSRMLADAVGQALRGVLQGFVAFLIAKGTAAAASRVPELVARLRASRLGAACAEWVERNWFELLEGAGVDMRHFLTFKGTVERGQLARGLKGKFVIRAEGMADSHPGNFFNGPFKSLAEARAAAQRLAASEAGLRQGNAVPRVWKDGGQSRVEVVRVYQIKYDVPGSASVAGSQPERGTVMVRPEHLEAFRLGKPWIAHEYRGGDNQLELPVKGLREQYRIEVVSRVHGEEYAIRQDGNGVP